jgi:hypothetical protein
MISQQISKITDKNNRLGYADSKGLGFFTVFNTDGDITYVCTCRDQFLASTSEKTDVAGFHFPNINIQSLNNFIEEIEEKLKLEEKMIFHTSTIKDLIVFEIPSFWRNHICNRSLLSLFIRAGVVYYNSTFENAITAYPLANSVKPAIDFFLEGNIFPTFTKWKGNGFVSEFAGITTPQELSNKLSLYEPIKFEVKKAEYFTQQSLTL